MMTKKEMIWREILCQVIENKKIEFTQKGLSKQFGFSLSTVFNALRVPRQIGAVKVTGRNFKVQNSEKFLYLWATQRNLAKDIIYQTNVAAGPKEIENGMPPEIIFACYSAYTRKYHAAPADYDKVYVYVDAKEIATIKKCFPPKKGYSNLIILQSDRYLKESGFFTSDVQTFADIWNLKEWYAKEFLDALKKKLF